MQSNIAAKNKEFVCESSFVSHHYMQQDFFESKVRNVLLFCIPPRRRNMPNRCLLTPIIRVYYFLHLRSAFASMRVRPDRALLAVPCSSAAVAAIVNCRRPAHRPCVDATPATLARRARCALSRRWPVQSDFPPHKLQIYQSIRFLAPHIANMISIIF